MPYEESVGRHLSLNLSDSMISDLMVDLSLSSATIISSSTESILAVFEEWKQSSSLFSLSRESIFCDFSVTLCSLTLTPIPFKVFLYFARLFLNQTWILASGKWVKSANRSRVETSGYWVRLKVDSRAANWLWVKAVRLLRCFRASVEVVAEEVPLIRFRVRSAKNIIDLNIN